MKNITEIDIRIKYEKLLKILNKNNLYTHYAKDLDLTDSNIFSKFKVENNIFITIVAIYIGKKGNNNYYYINKFDYNHRRLIKENFILICNNQIETKTYIECSGYLVDKKFNKKEVHNYKLFKKKLNEYFFLN